jgi:predicted acyl esterase
MIPTRDGVKLHTVILIPKGAKGAPILLTQKLRNSHGQGVNVHLVDANIP